MKVRKRLLKPIAVFMMVCVLLTLLGATGVAKDNTEVEIVVCDSICPQKAQQIINSINGEIGISPMGIFCIFGHNLATGTVWVTEHRVWSTSPRCRMTSYRVEYCTRSSCNYNVGTVIGTTRIQCC